MIPCSRHPCDHVLIILKPEAKHTAHENRLSFGVGIGGHHLEWHREGHYGADNPV